MTTTYEAMFLLDNEVVRKGWDRAKSLVTDTLEKHGAKVQTARRWEERLLAYPIRGRRRATYLLTYFDAEGPKLEGMRNDFDISEGVLRYLFLDCEEIPEEERGLSEAENADDFSVPEPPADDAPEVEEEAASEDGDSEKDGEKAKDGETAKEDEQAKEGEKAEETASAEGEGEAAAAAESNESEDKEKQS